MKTISPVFSVVKNPIKSCLRRAAFTMVEVAVAISIVGMGLLAVIGVMPTLLDISRQSIDSSELAFAGQNFIEYDYQANLSPEFISSNYTPATITGVASLTNSKFSVKGDVTYHDSTNASGGSFVHPVTGQKILVTQIVSYSWPPNAKKPNRFSFVTEMVANSNIIVRTP